MKKEFREVEHSREELNRIFLVSTGLSILALLLILMLTSKKIINPIRAMAGVMREVKSVNTNAAESMPHGGTIFIRTQNQYVDRPISGYDNVEEGDYAVLNVSDTGLGISSDSLPRMFEPFYTKK